MTEPAIATPSDPPEPVPPVDRSKALDWIEKQAQESMKSRVAVAEVISKDAQTTLTVLLAGLGAASGYGVTVLGSAPTPMAWGAAAATIFLIAVSVALVVKCIRFRAYPALYQNPKNLLPYLDDYGLEAIREEELNLIDARINEAAALNADRAGWLNVIRLLAAIGTPILLAGAAVAAAYWAPSVPAASETRIACSLSSAASGSGTPQRIDCKINK